MCRFPIQKPGWVWEQTFFNVIESVGVVEVCAIITSPFINCPVEFPFDVGTAGKTLSLKIE